MPNKPAIPLVAPRRNALDTHLPTHEQAARRHRRANEAPRTGTARSKPQRPAQPPLNPFPTSGPDWRTPPTAIPHG